MGLWAGIKYALNSTLGTDDFKPLDKQITDRIGLIPDENIYTSKYLAPNTTDSNLQPSFSTEHPNIRELSSMSLCVNTQGQVNLKAKGSITCVQNEASGNSNFHIRIYVEVNVFKNGELLYKSDQMNIGTLSEPDAGKPQTFTFTTLPFSSGFINKGDKITAQINIVAQKSHTIPASIVCTQSDVTFEVYGKTVIIDPTLFKTEIREET